VHVQTLNQTINCLVVDKDFPGESRDWEAMLGQPVPVVTVAEGSAADLGARKVVIVHASRTAVGELCNRAPASCIVIAGKGGGWSEEDARDYESARCYFRRLSLIGGRGVVDRGFQTCWQHFARSLNLGKPDFSRLDPRGVPGNLMAWVLMKMAGCAELPVFDESALRDEYNLLWEGARPTVAPPKLGPSDVPTVEQAMSPIRRDESQERSTGHRGP